MKKLLRPLIFDLFLFLSFANSGFAVSIGDSLSHLKIPGYASNVPEFKIENKISIINFWATWCAACKIELKEMQTLFNDFFKDNSIFIAFVTLDSEPKIAAKWLEDTFKGDAATFLQRLYIDPELAIANQLKAAAFPLTLITDKNGKVIYMQENFTQGSGSTEKMVKIVASLK